MTNPQLAGARKALNAYPGMQIQIVRDPVAGTILTPYRGSQLGAPVAVANESMSSDAITNALRASCKAMG